MSAEAQSATASRPPLDDVMLAMDVVDTLRRRQQLVERELDEGGRALDLKERLRKIYHAQGIEVPDHVLDEGAAALREDRFVYQPPAPSLATRLAHLYVRRRTWGRWLVAGVVALGVAWGAYHATVVAPRAALPGELTALHDAVLALTRAEPARERAASYLATARTALRDGDEKAARKMRTALADLRSTLEQEEYTLRIVSRPGERSGFWRIPDDNPDAQNFYLVVEALDAQGATGSDHREDPMKTSMLALFALALVAGPAQAAEAARPCEALADSEKLAGAARASFLKKCETDTTAFCEARADEKKLAGAARTSSVNKCETEPSAVCEGRANDRHLSGAARTSFLKKCESDLTPAH